MKTIIHHSEIALKGKNSGYYEYMLIKNIKKSFSDKTIKIKKDSRRIVCDIDLGKKEITKRLKKIFGIKYFSFPVVAEKNVENILKKTDGIIKKFSKKGIKKIAIYTKRSDKSFPLTSIELNKKIGKLANDHKIKIDFSNPEQTIFVEITLNSVYISSEKIESYGSLPVSSSGKVLCLLSGGIDSAVAAWLMMKRGCKVDFIHFHTYKDNKAVLKTKIKKIINILNDYQYDSKVYLIPYHKYQIKTLGKVKNNLDLVVFRNFMFKTAKRIAIRNRHRAIISGDSVAQVASQTLLNLGSAAYDVGYLILRPVIGYTKDEIIDLAKNIGTYEATIEHYKDCCSIISRKPALDVKVKDIKDALSEVDMDSIIKDSIKAMDKVKITG